MLSLETVKNQWNPASTNNYCETLKQMDDQVFLHKLFNSFQVLSGVELSGERIYVAYFNANQEDEHSCFSDNTHRDIALNALGIQNLYLGTYNSPLGRNVSGKGMEAIVNTLDADLNNQLLVNFSTVNSAIANMYQPFDQAIVLPQERPKVLETVHLLEEQRSIFLIIAKQFGQTY